ncbi:Heavy metal-associated isoprenylated plant protein 32 [Glycine soja]
MPMAGHYARRERSRIAQRENWVDCLDDTCKSCYEQANARFNPLNSSTYEASDCLDDTCKDLISSGQGVCKVDINAEEQTAIVTGIFNPSTLVQKLAKFGKHAEIWDAGYNGDQNNNQAQLINNHSDYENQYMIPTFGENHWGPQWGFNAGLENSETIYAGLENQEWARNFPGESSTSKYGHQPSPMANIHEYHHEFHPSNMMQFSSHIMDLNN